MYRAKLSWKSQPLGVTLTHRLVAVVLTIVLLCCVSNAQGSSDHKHFCSALKLILRAGKDNFTPLRGAPLISPSAGVYKSTVMLPGANGCDVQPDEGPGGRVSCSFNQGSVGDAADRVRPCLSGGDWIEEHETRGSLAGLRSFHTRQKQYRINIQQNKWPLSGVGLAIWAK